MPSVRAARVLLALCFALVALLTTAAHADEVWIPPSSQSDLGGLEIASNTFWPVTPIGAVRLAWAVPNNLQTFQGAKVVLIPGVPGGAASVTVYVCAAQNGNSAVSGCAGPFAQPFISVPNQLIEVEIGPTIAARIGAPGVNYLTVLAYTAPTTTTDHIVGMRFSFTPTAPMGAATLGANTFSGTQTAPQFSGSFVGNGSGLTNLPTPSGVATLGANTFSGTQTAPAFVGSGAGLTNLPLPAGAATLGANTFSGTQTIATGNLDLAGSGGTGNITRNGTTFLRSLETNIFLGREAGNGTTTGDQNTAVGHQAMFYNTTGGANTALGYGALLTNMEGGGNVAIGLEALMNNMTGMANTAVGFGALQNSNGSDNLAVGLLAGSSLSTGTDNIYLGKAAGQDNESNTMYLGVHGIQQRAFIGGVRGVTPAGADAVPVVIDASGQLGTVSLSGIATLSANTFTGTQTAPAFSGGGSGLSDVNASLLDGLDSTAFAGAAHGHDVSQVTNAARLAGGNSFSGSQVIDAGNLDLDLSTASAGNILKSGIPFLHNFGSFNTFLGMGAGNFSMTGMSNTAVGDGALLSNTTGNANLANGINALRSNTAGNGNTATGSGALYSNTTGLSNTASGLFTLQSNTTGNSNTANGVSALIANTTGTGNTASGQQALFANTSGGNNVAVGVGAGTNATTGSNNIYLGAGVLGVAGESNAMYLGKVGIQTATFIAGVRGTTVSGGESVVIDAAGRLGSGPVTPGANTIGTNEVIDNSLTASDLAPSSVGSSELASDSITADKVAFNYAGSSSEGGAASNLACVGCVDASEVSFSFTGTRANTFTATQTIDTGNLDLDNSTATTGNITKNGAPFLHNVGINNTFLGVNAGNVGTTGSDNTAVGQQGLLNNSTGGYNTTVGSLAMSFNTTGGANTVIGASALFANTTGASNTVVGSSALSGNTNGSANTVVGTGSMSFNTSGSANTALGVAALLKNTTGGSNTAIGYNALLNVTSGLNNVGVGTTAGGSATTGINNIYLGANVSGIAGESDAMYLGRVGTQTKTMIAGVRGTTTGVFDAIPVVIDSNGQLGTTSSSIRFKEDIHDMAGASKRLLQLRPVTFRYIQPYINGAKPIQYGLVAEEVAEVFPELAVRGADGQVETVHYETLNVLLLNELQEQVRLNNDQQQRIEALERKLNALLEAR